jgi:hypothetical protein
MRRQLYVLAFILAALTPSLADAQQQPAPLAQPSPSQPAPAPQTPAPPQTAGFGGTTDNPTFEVGLGYQFLRAGGLCFDDDDTDGDDECGDARSFPLGFAIDGVRNFGRVGLVGELGWSRDSDDLTIGTDSATFAENLFHYAAGVRVSGHNAGRFWPYGQVLVGGVTSRVSADFDDDTLETDATTRTRLMIQPGIGATVVGGDGWGIFGQVDYRRVFLDEDEDGSSGRNDLRIFIGVRAILD